MLNEVISTSSTEEDQVTEAGTNVELEEKPMNGTYMWTGQNFCYNVPKKG